MTAKEDVSEALVASRVVQDLEGKRNFELPPTKRIEESRDEINTIFPYSLSSNNDSLIRSS